MANKNPTTLHGLSWNPANIIEHVEIKFLSKHFARACRQVTTLESRRIPMCLLMFCTLIFPEQIHM